MDYFHNREIFHIFGLITSEMHMTLEELHQKLNLLARVGMQDSAFMVQVPKKRRKTSDKSIGKIDFQESKNKFYIQARLFD